jgi:hypothetical protein
MPAPDQLYAASRHRSPTWCPRSATGPVMRHGGEVNGDGDTALITGLFLLAMAASIAGHYRGRRRAQRSIT